MPRSELESTAGKYSSRSPETMSKITFTPRSSSIYYQINKSKVTELEYQKDIATVCGDLIAPVGLPDAAGFKPNGRKSQTQGMKSDPAGPSQEFRRR